MLVKNDVKNQLLELLDLELIESISISNPIKKDIEKSFKIKIEPIILKDKEVFQVSEYVENKVLHKNIEKNILIDYILEVMEENFKQCNITGNKFITILMNKKRNFTITGVKNNINSKKVVKGHNKAKNYIIGEGEYVDWMYQLGLMDKNGAILQHKQKKFRQINKFLEMLKDIESEIPENSIIIDMGCGKSYLSFAMYHYFNIIKKETLKLGDMT